MLKIFSLLIYLILIVFLSLAYFSTWQIYFTELDSFLKYLVYGIFIGIIIIPTIPITPWQKEKVQSKLYS